MHEGATVTATVKTGNATGAEIVGGVGWGKERNDACSEEFTENLRSSLINACKDNNRSDLEKILSAHPDLINSVHMWGSTPLIASCSYNARECTRFLLGMGGKGGGGIYCGLDVNMRDERGGSALTYACVEGDVEVVKRILAIISSDNNDNDNDNDNDSDSDNDNYVDFIAKVYHPTVDKNLHLSPLMAACVAGEFECTKALLDFGAKPEWTPINSDEKQYDDIKAAIVYAIMGNHAEIVDLLLEYQVKSGAGLTGFDYGTAIELACCINLKDKVVTDKVICFTDGDDEVCSFDGGIQMAEENMKMKMAGRGKNGVLACVLSSISDSQVKYQLCADELGRVKPKTFPLHKCAQNNNVAGIECILSIILKKEEYNISEESKKSGGDSSSLSPINQVDSRGWTALMHAVKAGFADVIKLIVDTGCAELNTTDKHNRSVWTLLDKLPASRKERVRRLLESATKPPTDDKEVFPGKSKEDEERAVEHLPGSMC